MRGNNNITYMFNFITFAITFAFIAVSMIIKGITTTDIILFSFFIIFAMIALIGSSQKSNWGWFLSLILFAFLISYLVSSFIGLATIILFILIVLNVIAFLLSVVSVGNRAVEKRESDIQTRLDELVEEKRALENDFHTLESAAKAMSDVTEIKDEGARDEPKAKEERYVTSPTSNLYHAKDCPAAKRIKKKKYVSADEAKKSKLKKHSCI